MNKIKKRTQQMKASVKARRGEHYPASKELSPQQLTKVAHDKARNRFLKPYRTGQVLGGVAYGERVWNERQAQAAQTIESLGDSYGATGDPETTKQFERNYLETLTVPQIQAYADEGNIKYKKKMRKADLIDLIVSA